jgi:hypothetical protein
MRSCPKKEAFRSAFDKLNLSLIGSSATNRQGTDIWLDILYVLSSHPGDALRSDLRQFYRVPNKFAKGLSRTPPDHRPSFKFLGRVLGPARISIHLMRDYLNLRDMLLTALFPSCGVLGLPSYFL